jgi:hypothetical protein
MTRSLLIVAAFSLSVAACERPSDVSNQTANVTLNPHERTIRSSTPKDCFAIALGEQASGGWVGLGLGRSNPKADPSIEIRCSDAPARAVKVEVTFKGTFDPHLASLTFLHLTKVDQVMEGPNQRYQAWDMKGENFELKSPKTAAKITFLAWPHVH